MSAKEFLGRLIAVFFPTRCVFCGEVVAYDDLICGRCEYIPCGGKDLAAAVWDNLSGVLAVAQYAGGAQNAVLRLKKYPDERAARFFAEHIAAKACEYWPGTRFDLIVPVPASADRLKETGYNHAGLLAQEIGAILHVPVNGDVLSRDGASLPQHNLNARQRLENAAKSYRAAKPELVLGKTVLLADDVLTTGATAKTCANCLLAAGAKAVYFAAATFTPPKPES